MGQSKQAARCLAHGKPSLSATRCHALRAAGTLSAAHGGALSPRATCRLLESLSRRVLGASGHTDKRAWPLSAPTGR